MADLAHVGGEDYAWLAALAYAETYHWPFRWAPHDLGTYPHANGHDYPANVDLNSVEGHMPAEESANMILMAAAIAKADGNADYAARYWPLFSKWANYLNEKGLDPERQVVTDDFTGPLAHNVNLAVKAISALGAYLAPHGCGRRPLPTGFRPARYLEPEIQSRTGQVARPGPFSFGRGPSEIKFYQTKQNAYGLPLDLRALYTKLDWLLWTATLTDNQADFVSFLAPAYKFTNETPDRLPLTDFCDTDTGKHRAFQARSVVGASS